jgi:hypothetical protein
MLDFDGLMPELLSVVPVRGLVDTVIFPFLQERSNCYLIQIGNGYGGEWEVFVCNSKAEVVEYVMKQKLTLLLHILSNYMNYLSICIVQDSIMKEEKEISLKDLLKIRSTKFNRHLTRNEITDLSYRYIRMSVSEETALSSISRIVECKISDPAAPQRHLPANQEYIFEFWTDEILEFRGNIMQKMRKKKNIVIYGYHSKDLTDYFDAEDFNPDGSPKTQKMLEDDPRKESFHYGRNIF